ncbi:MAG TPA: copper resistance CopC family protein [Gemmatimonadales bacterium]
MRSEPGADSTVKVAPTAIRLWFTEPLQLAVSTVRLSDAAGHAVATGKPYAAAAANSPVAVDVQGHLGAGRYTVTWRAMPRDGHVSSGHFAFTVAPAASH